MAQDNKKDLSTDELLKKLLTSFGGDESEEEQGDQLTIDDAAQEAKRQNRPKVFRVNAKKEEQESAQSESEELKQDKNALEEQIRRAELFVAGMQDRAKDEEEQEMQAEDAAPSASEQPFEEAAGEQEEVRDGESALEKEEAEDEFLAPLFVDFPEIGKGPHADKDRGADSFEEKEEKEEIQPASDKEDEEELQAGLSEEPAEERTEDPSAEPEEQISQETQRAQEDVPDEEAEQEQSEVPPRLENRFYFREEQPEANEGEIVALNEDGAEAEDEAEAEEDLSDLPTEQPEQQAKQDERSEQAGSKDGQSVEMDEKEIGIMMLFGDKKKLEDAVGKEELSLRLKKMLGDADAESIKEEYVSHDQDARFFKMLRSAYTRLNIRAIAALVVFLCVLMLEAVLPLLVSAQMPLEALIGSGAASVFDNPVLTALLGLQVTFLIGAVAYKELLQGLKAFVTGRSIPQMFFAVSMIFTVIYEIALLFCRNISAPFYNLPLALTALVAVSYTGMKVARSILSFNVVSTKRPKFTVTHLTEGSANPEKEAFEEYLSENTGMFGVGKTDFVTNFAMRNAREPRYKSIVMILATVCAVLGVIFFLLGYYFAPENQLLSGLVAALQSVLFSVPASAFITYSLPFFRASKKAFANDSAIIGEFSLEEYADATVISFDDKEVFPAKNVKVRSLKLFGDTRIDHVLFGAASVFHRVGGPLDDVFGVATRESGYSDNVDILEAVSGGVEAAVDGELVRFGDSAFMRSKGLLSFVDPDDAAMEMEGKVSVMYMSIGQKLAAKMYISYGADPEIEEIMSSLYKAGMCIGIRTLDPNIDDRMISTHVDLSKYPVKVLRMDRKERELYSKEAESGVVSKRNVKSLLKTLTYCRRVLQVVRVGTVIKILGMVLGIGASALLLFLSATGRIGGVYEVSSLWILLYQLCLMLPTLIVSVLFV
ncbi:MAG: hypothetical protein IJZ33_00780 [Clostridia bacterium]|nr:hypothetical protein [Clostridia bacterium]